MLNIWEFFPILPTHIDGKDLVRRCQFLNSAELFRAGYPRWESFDQGNFPIAQLELTSADFDADLLHWGGRYLVSEKMRSAMRLDHSGVLYFDVDASRSSPLVRSKNFKLMEVTAVEGVSDPEKSKYEMVNFGAGIRPRPSLIYSVAMREDAAPAHALFRDHFFRRLFCTDALAVRVLKAGCTGVRFADPAQLSIGAPMRFRTLRGIEELDGWDPVNQTENMKLVHPIH